MTRDLVSKIDALPPDQQAEISDYVQFLLDKENKRRMVFNAVQHAPADVPSNRDLPTSLLERHNAYSEGVQPISRYEQF
jgi:hypothetical protein